MPKIILTGGGSAGHVTPNLAMIPALQQRGWTLAYIGTHDGIERKLVGDAIPYYPISAGKLRRYFDWKNFTDPFRVLKGVYDAWRVLRRHRPDIVFSKGGFVSLPVAVAARLLGIPVVLHESDFTPGLANRLALPFSTHLCVTFPETMEHVPKHKASVTGNPIRRELLNGDPDKARELWGFDRSKPVMLVIGGSLGAAKINQVVRESLPQLLAKFQIAHICGKGNTLPSLTVQGYHQFEYVDQDLPHLFALADLVISRAGANAVFELLALKKPHLLIPLSQSASRGDQLLNARSFARQGFSMLLEEEQLTGASLIEAVEELWQNREHYRKAMSGTKLTDAVAEVVSVIESIVKKQPPGCQPGGN